MWTALIWLLQVASIVGATCATLYLIRRHKPEGLAAVIIAPANIITGVATRLADWFRTGSQRLATHADRHGSAVFGGAAHPLATGVMYIGLASIWVAVMVLYVTRNATIVLTEHRELLQSRLLLDPAFVDPKPLASVMALAEVFAPVMLTAVAGIIVIELLGFTDHIPFLHRERRSQKLLLGSFALAVLAVAMVMQLSVAQQDMANAANEVQATITARQTADIPPLPARPTQAEAQLHATRVAEFKETVEAPLWRAYSSTVGPMGWRTWLPIGAALVDFVFAFALVPALIILWIVLVRLSRAPLELLRAALNGAAYVARLVGGVILRTLGLQEPATLPAASASVAATSPTGAAPSAPVPVAPAATFAPLPAAGSPSTTDAVRRADPVSPAAPPARPSWAGSASSSAPSGETSASPAAPSVDRFDPFAGSVAR
jgi:hypothetical protein